MTYLDRCTTAEFDGLDRSVPLLLPTGAVEQHGPHLPIATDRMVAEHFASAADRVLGDRVVVLPTVQVGCSDHHLDFAGTLSVRHDTFLGQVEDYAESALAYGFESLLILNAHGGNQGIGRVALERLGARHRGRRIVFTSWWQLAAPELLGISETGPGGVGHAGELETSLMLLIAPDLVRLAQAPPRYNQPAFDWDAGDMLRGSRASQYQRLIDIASTGVFGEPRGATAAKGRAASDAVIAQLVAVLRSLDTWMPGTEYESC